MTEQAKPAAPTAPQAPAAPKGAAYRGRRAEGDKPYTLMIGKYHTYDKEGKRTTFVKGERVYLTDAQFKVFGEPKFKPVITETA